MARYLDGETGRDIDLLAEAVSEQTLVLSPPTITELMSHAVDRPLLAQLLSNAVVLPLTTGFWERAGLTRRKLRALGLKAKLADTLIAQCCIDADIPLIAHDPDFRHFATHCRLKLAV
jgi:predicted nucleic acid-binding protein